MYKIPSGKELIELANALTTLEKYKETGLTPEDCAKFAKAKQEKRLIILPCPEGTPVWAITYDCSFCHDIENNDEEDFLCVGTECKNFIIFETVFSAKLHEDFGKTIFINRKEAENAVKKT